MARSPELLALLSKTSSFIGDADALLRTSISRERQRVSAIFESVNRTTASASEGNLIGTVASGGRAIGQAAKFLGFGSKAIGPISELPLVQLASENVQLRFVKTKAELINDRNIAMDKDPSDGFRLPFRPDKSGSPNRFGPDARDGGTMTPYSRDSSEGGGKYATDRYKDQVFPFKIENLALRGMVATPTSEIFVAYIRNLTESISPTWTAKDYLGRAEAVQVYGGASRTVQLGIVLMATNPSMENRFTAEDELGYQIPVSNFDSGPLAGFTPDTATALMDNSISKADMWRKLDFLSSLAYPSYDSEGRFDKAPYGRLTLGNLYVDQLFVLTNVSYSYSPLIWDINDVNMISPMIVDITMALTLIHESSPGILPGSTRPDGTPNRAALAYTRADGTRKFYTRGGITGREDGEGS